MTGTSPEPVSLMVFTRDLRLADHPALTAASRRGPVVCAFIHDEALRSGRPMHPLRTRFLEECLAGLDASLRRSGSRLVQRRGDWADEVLRLAAESGARSVHASDDVTPYARRRFDRLRRAAGRGVQFCVHPGLTAVAPGDVAPADADHYRVFTPYYRRWTGAERRSLLPPPATLRAPPGVPASVPARERRRSSPSSASALGRGGEGAAHDRLRAWARAVEGYADGRDDLADPGSSGLSRDLHFGCLSPLQVEEAVDDRPGAAPFLRQLCWRDFYLQILAARPEAAWSDFVHRGARPRRDPAAFEAWRTGLTGVPIVDAAMRQLAGEGYLPNRARMIAASFLTRQLGLDWREGARHFLEHLVDADVALNNLNWQWMAGRGTGTNPRRVLSPVRQARRFDPAGTYVRRHLPELRRLEAPSVHEPWRLDPRDLARLGYPPPVVPVGGTTG